MKLNLFESDYAKMEGKPSPHLKKVLKSYELAAANTLSGPSSVMSRLEGSSGSGGGSSGGMMNSSGSSAGRGGLGGSNTLQIMKSNYSDPNGLILEKISPGSSSAMSKIRRMSMSTNDRDEGVICREIKQEVVQKEEVFHHGRYHQMQRGPPMSPNSPPPPNTPPNGRGGMGGGLNRSFSSSESSTISSGSTSASPVSQYNDYEMSPPRRQTRERSPESSVDQGRVQISHHQMSPTTPPATSANNSSGFPSWLMPAVPIPKKLMHRHNYKMQMNHLELENRIHQERQKQQQQQQQQIQQQQQQEAQINRGTRNVLGALHHHLNLQNGSLRHILPPAVGFQPPPVFSTPDRCSTEKKETQLAGVAISCFVVGGEKRLCFPQILTTVLRPFSLQQINQICDELQIFCSRCSKEQLEILKVTGVLPMSAHSCGLITKSDAERLVNALKFRDPPKAAVGSVTARNQASVSFRVFHGCFGKGKGILFVNLYERVESLCIECVDCNGLFTPARFVAHVHRRPEVRAVCHWGFDSAKWRTYLMVDRDQENVEKWEKVLSDFKGKFDHKRKESIPPSPNETEPEDNVVIKRIRYNEEVPVPTLTSPGSGVTIEPALYLPTKKRLPYIQYSDNDHTNLAGFEEVDSVKKMLLSRMDNDGAQKVIKLIDKMCNKISSLEQICQNQKTLKRIAETQSESDLQSRVNSMAAELQSLQKQLIRRQEQRDVI